MGSILDIELRDVDRDELSFERKSIYKVTTFQSSVKRQKKDLESSIKILYIQRGVEGQCAKFYKLKWHVGT